MHEKGEKTNALEMVGKFDNLEKWLEEKIQSVGLPGCGRISARTLFVLRDGNKRFDGWGR